MKVSDFKTGDTIRILASKEYLAPWGFPKEDQEPYTATVIGTSEHIVSGQSTKHVILGWHENPFPSGKMPKEVEIDHNVMSRDMSNYRYKAFVPADFKCVGEEAFQARKASDEEEARKKQVREELLTTITRLELAKVKESSQQEIENLLSPLWKDYNAYKDDARKDAIHRKNQETLLSAVSTSSKDELNAVMERLKVEIDAAKSKGLIPPKTTLRQAKLNDRVRLKLTDSDETAIEGTVFAIKPREDRSLSPDYLMIGFDTVPTNIGPLDPPHWAIERFTTIDRQNRFKAWKTYHLDLSCEILPATTLMDSKLGDRVRLTINGKEVEGTVFTNPGAGCWADKVCVGFESSGNDLDIGFVFERENPPDRTFFPMQLDIDPFLTWRDIQLDTTCTILPPKEESKPQENNEIVFTKTLKNAKLGDTVRYYMHDRVVEGTVIAQPIDFPYDGSLKLIGFTATSKIPVEQEDRLYTTGDPSKRFRYYDEHLVLSSDSPYIASAAERLDTPCEVIPTTQPVKKLPITLRDAKLGDRVRVILNDGRSVDLTVIGVQPKSVFNQDFMLLGFDKESDVPTGLSCHIITPTSTFTTYEHYVDNPHAFAAGRTASLDIPCEILPASTDWTIPVSPTVFAYDGYSTLNGSFNGTISIPQRNFTEPTSGSVLTMDGYGWTTWQGDLTSTYTTTTTNAIINTPLTITGIDLAATSIETPKEPEPVIEKPKKTTLADAQLGDRVAIQYGEFVIDATVVAIGHPGYVCVGYRPSEKNAWFGKVIVGSLEGNGSYPNVAEDIGEYDCGTSFRSDTECAILPKIEIEPETAGEVKGPSLMMMLGAALGAGLMKALAEPKEGVRVQEVIDEEPLVEEEQDEQHANTG